MEINGIKTINTLGGPVITSVPDCTMVLDIVKLTFTNALAYEGTCRLSYSAIDPVSNELLSAERSPIDCSLSDLDTDAVIPGYDVTVGVFMGMYKEVCCGIVSGALIKPKESVSEE